MFQQITIVGNVGSDPVSRFTPAGVQVTSFSVAASRKWKNAEGELQEKTVWFRVAVWNKQAEACAEYIRKGMRVLVVGEVEAPRVFINQKTGQPQCQLEVTADNVRFLTSKDELEAHYREQSHGAVGAHPGQPEIEAAPTAVF